MFPCNSSVTVLHQKCYAGTQVFHDCRVCLGRLLQTQSKSNAASQNMAAEGMKAPSHETEDLLPWKQVGLRP